MKSRILELARFGITGILATGVHYLFLKQLVETETLSPAIANGFAFLAALMVTYIGQKYWVFTGSKRHDNWQAARFLASTVFGLIANVLIMWLSTKFLGLDYSVGFLLGLVVIPILSYFINRFWVFRKNEGR